MSKTDEGDSLGRSGNIECQIGAQWQAFGIKEMYSNYRCYVFLGSHEKKKKRNM